MSKHNARVFLDVLLPPSDKPERFIIELFTHTVPMTAHHFRSLFASGLYKGCSFHRCIPEFMIQTGEHPNLNNLPTLPTSLEKEGFLDPQLYNVVMANDENGHPSNQFFILTSDAPHLQGSHVVFGKLISGFESVHQVEQVPVDEEDRPLESVLITHCGELIKQSKPQPPTYPSQPVSPLPRQKIKQPTSSSPSFDKKVIMEDKKVIMEDKKNKKSVTAEVYTLLFGSSASEKTEGKKRKLMHTGNVRYDPQGRKIKGRGFTKFRPS
ncbi:hypothetical protein HMI54_005145 [Coelomomyces lativittatus]|nr:hypothetical protein HMI56_006594 [Coelomomyces lativittatus]KAJ1512972.1 hypothetical protein HMI55_006010 [Coelomomyces lativittatus]KAJ1517579.1 hypothetical protein HMI54_005145 [Coelomomyces lativittatus]